MKAKKKSNAPAENKVKIRLIETDHPGGPWPVVPEEEIQRLEPSLDEARIGNPALNWSLPVDLLTELYDDAMRINTGVCTNGLEIIRKRFGQNCTLFDVDEQLRSKYKITTGLQGLGFPRLLKIITTDEVKEPAEPIQADTKMSLREFLEKCTDVDNTVIDSKIKRIKAVNKLKHLLPKTANNPTGNQTKLYYQKHLVSVWSALKDEIPTLPNMINIQG